jgi:hypothetical protein
VTLPYKAVRMTAAQRRTLRAIAHDPRARGSKRTMAALQAKKLVVMEPVPGSLRMSAVLTAAGKREAQRLGYLAYDA